MGQSLLCWRFFLLSAAIVVAISGVVVIAASGYFIYEFQQYEPLTPANVYGSPSILLTMGVLTSILGWYTWQFTNFGNKGQVIIVGLSLGVISSFEMSAGIWALVRHEKIVDMVSVPQLESMYSLTTEDDKHVRQFCCDIVGSPEYYDEDSFHSSCCNISSPINSNSTKDVCTSIYAKGCFHVIINHTRSVLLHVFLLAQSSVILQICFMSSIIHYMKAVMRRRKLQAMMCAQLSPQAGAPNDDNKNPFRHYVQYST